MNVKTLVDRFGSNRMNAQEPGKLLRGCKCVGVPFAGGMCEVPFFTANVINVNDLDCHVINLGRVVRRCRERLQEALDATMYHPVELAAAQEYCRFIERRRQEFGKISLFGGAVDPDVLSNQFEWAFNYFIASWMTRGGKGGTRGEFETGISIRWKRGGGDSVVRFRNATAELTEWEKVMRRCTFTTLDAFELLAECKQRDISENGIYVDADWPDDGTNYKHKIGNAGQSKLRDVLQSFQRTRVVVRYGDHPLIRELYKEPRWTWNLLTGRTQRNDAKQEVLLTNWRP